MSRREYDKRDRYDSYDRNSRKRQLDDDERTEPLPDLDSVFRGEVVSIQAYGAFIKIPGHRKNGLVHKSQISTTRVDEVSDVLSVGDQVFCKVISSGGDDSKISLSMKDVNQSDGKTWNRDSLNDINESDNREDRRKSREDEPMPQLYSIFRGEVMSLQDYGAFIKIPGFRKNGLVHRSQISSVRIEEVSDVLSVGDKVFCKVVSLGEEDGGGKISLSMKVVNQDNGKDLDPNLVITNQEEMKKNKGGVYTQKRIELGAVFNTVCRKCGTKGHLSQNCFSGQSGKTYELLPELDIPVPADQPEQLKTEAGHVKKKKKKKEKKKAKKSSKKKHRHKYSSSESDSSSSDSDSDSHRKHRPKKHKDQKRRKHLDSSSDSDRRKKSHHHKRNKSLDSSDSERERTHKHKQKKHHRDR